MRWALAGACLVAGAALLQQRLSDGLPSLGAVHLAPESAIEDLAFLGLGMRRQAADFHFIRLLQYYGTSEGPEEEEHHHEGHHHGEGGVYPEIYPRTLRMLELDPYFRYGVLYAAGALAFNLNRPEEAVALLHRALEHDPQAWRYQLYIAAIAYKKDREYGRLVEVLEPALSDPDCPAMLKAIVAGIYQKLGKKERAIALYRDIESNSKDPEYRELARSRIEKLLH